MTNTTLFAGELATSISASTIICTSVNTEPLLTALITFGVSIITLVGGELVKFLIAYFQKKTKELKDDNSKKED